MSACQHTDNMGLFKQSLSLHIAPERLIDSPLKTLAYGTDASLYRLIPQLVIKVINEEEVRDVIAIANRFNIGITFRAAGTSLSGQAITDSVLVVLDGSTWQDYEILDNGKKIRLQPGLIGAHVNSLLLPYGRKIGPDPASIASAKIGGIAANNASGMCCGIAQNSYQTLDHMRIIFADGSILDTNSMESRTKFQETHGELLAKISQLAQQTKQNPALFEKIKHKYQIKNTTGYSLNALVDFSEPFEILSHLLIGSEGSLGFISEISYHTVVEHQHKASALVIFKDLYSACETVSLLKKSPVAAVELMDGAALKAVSHKHPHLEKLQERHCALLIETRANDIASLDAQIKEISPLIQEDKTLYPVEFSQDLNECAKLWDIRKGLFPSVGKIRSLGTTVIIEDVAFPIERLADASIMLQQLFKKYAFDDAIIFGHALAGNLHFVISPDFSSPDQIDSYDAFMQELSYEVVDKFNGSLKAEHSTGRNMAPFVELEWGKDAYALMKDIKAIFDPNNILNPGVILNSDEKIHIKNLKPMPKANKGIDYCIECGFCESICPSRNLSLTPRQRIVILREMASLALSKKPEDQARLKQFEVDYQYLGIDTCASDSLCAIKCPLSIDTGQMIKELKREKHSRKNKNIAAWCANHINAISKLSRVGLKTTDVLAKLDSGKSLSYISHKMSHLSEQKIPRWDVHMPKAAKAQTLKQLAKQTNRGQTKRDQSSKTNSYDKTIIYLPSCLSRTMGPSHRDKTSDDLATIWLRLFEKAGFKVIIPKNIHQLCCGLPFASKGLDDAAQKSLDSLYDELCETSVSGSITIVSDTSPCTHRLQTNNKEKLDILDTISFINRILLKHLNIDYKVEKIALHVTCSAIKMGIETDFVELAHKLSHKVFRPLEQGCCGFGGDKGFFVPELNQSALSRLKEQLPNDCSEGYSNSRSCEIGLSRHSGIEYRSIAYLLDKCTSEK